MQTIIPTVPDLVGHLATLLIILGIIQKSTKRIRFFMVLGSLAFVAYGFLIDALPVVLANTIIGLVSARYLYSEIRQKHKNKK